ncbi:MAG: hypothetical protein OXG82_02945 [Gammaproteobacteria bacterium]|nr:hypothetical protein [Gammaproteobacteria bacterium]
MTTVEHDGRPEGKAARVERLLAFVEPTPADQALVRFAAEKIVADRPAGGFEAHALLMRAKLKEARLLERALGRFPTVDSASVQAAAAASDALREGRLEDVEAVLADAENSTTDAAVRLSARAARGEVAMVRGDATQAAAHMAVVADFCEEGEEYRGSDEDATPAALYQRSAESRSRGRFRAT